MTTSQRERLSDDKEQPRQGLSATEKSRRQMIGAHLTQKAARVERFNLTAQDQRQMTVLDATDPLHLSDYQGFPDIQADQVVTAKAAAERAYRISEDSLRGQAPAIFTAAALETPPPIDMLVISEGMGV